MIGLKTPLYVVNIIFYIIGINHKSRMYQIFFDLIRLIFIESANKNAVNEQAILFLRYVTTILITRNFFLYAYDKKARMLVNVLLS